MVNLHMSQLARFFSFLDEMLVHRRVLWALNLYNWEALCPAQAQRDVSWPMAKAQTRTVGSGVQCTKH